MVAMSGDGRRVAVGAPDYAFLQTGHVFVHTFVPSATGGNNGSWGVGQRIAGLNDVFHEFGYDVTFSGDGSTLACSAPNANRKAFVLVYKLQPDGVTYDDNVIIEPDVFFSRFGWSISLSGDGGRLAV